MFDLIRYRGIVHKYTRLLSKAAQLKHGHNLLVTPRDRAGVVMRWIRAQLWAIHLRYSIEKLCVVYSKVRFEDNQGMINKPHTEALLHIYGGMIRKRLKFSIRGLRA